MSMYLYCNLAKQINQMARIYKKINRYLISLHSWCTALHSAIGISLLKLMQQANEPVAETLHATGSHGMQHIILDKISLIM